MISAPAAKPRALSSEQLTALLVERILGWKACPDRFIKSGREWIARNRFKPFARLEDALSLLAGATKNYSLTCVDGVFTADVQISGRSGQAVGEPKAATICLAISRALGIEVPR